MDLYQATKVGIRNRIAPYGLMDSYASRFLAFSAATAAALWIIKPKTFFDAQGNPYPNKAISDEGASREIDWIAASGLVGLFFITVI